MDAKELIEQGDIHFQKEEFTQAFSSYHEAHMLNDPYGTYKLAECFRIAFHRQNFDNADYCKCRDYAKNAIDLYAISYKQFGCDNDLHRDVFWYARRVRYVYQHQKCECETCERRSCDDCSIPNMEYERNEEYDKQCEDWYKQRFRDDILLKRIFVKRLINDSKCDLPEETLIIQKFQENENEYRNYPYNEFAMFLSADIHKKVVFLLRLTKEYSSDSICCAESYLRIAASAIAYRHCCSEEIYKLEAGEIVQALIDANHRGAKFDISNMCTKMKVLNGKRPPDEPGIWCDVKPTEWDMEEENFLIGDIMGYEYDGEEGSYYSEEECYCDVDGYYCNLRDYYNNNYDDE